MEPHLESAASCSKKMWTPAQDFWNCVAREILVRIFSYLPLKDRHTSFSVCQRWAVALSLSLVWRFTEIGCNAEEMEECMWQCLRRYLCHVIHLRIVLDQSQKANRRQVAHIFDMLIQQRGKLQALCLVCCGRRPDFGSSQDILQGFRKFCLSKDKIDLHYIDFRQTSFMLENGIVHLIGTSNPNLHTLLINNHPSGVIFLRPQTIVEVLRVCPKLSTLGVYHAMLSEDVIQELLKPDREPFLFLDIFCKGLDSYISEELWSALTEKHPQLRVGLEFGPMVSTWEISMILKPNIPVTALKFDTLTSMVRQIQYVTDNYSRTLERLVLHTTPSDDLNLSLIELVRTCVHLKEIHCRCAVSQAVIDAFLLNCPRLIRYTLSTP
ncbi:F-box/LRR-repeat protein 8-like isoform X2 [Hemicordylus capensis]|nr:F-box/LRR-repeat protein 8-like isoform X2 [Hemicordylus capensis]XP_053126800.1 F-box/LRR-repeat protein 8-like isoform X2 [Hemicordylus capensis]XP_053126801.1 F-box/LRR-repeat protein 8-like isoform X2 [Hemicordylus capensis]XP_053126802.1 F-box/LRR-repeat protein 8-like isoform X2 [Hemicordylus capensis]XP_053126803.1 F-box/LRR-repeat protein 8-like isoform X2 [Hemicordylus capensis]